MDRRAFLTALMGALAAPAAPALVSLKEGSERIYPAGSAISIEIVNPQVFERPFSYFMDAGTITADYDFCATALSFFGDPAARVELIVNGKPLHSEPIPALHLGSVVPFPLCPPIAIPKGTTLEFRSHDGETRMMLSGSQLLTKADLEAMPQEPEEIGSEFFPDEDWDEEDD